MHDQNLRGRAQRYDGKMLCKDTSYTAILLLDALLIDVRSRRLIVLQAIFAA
jgi:hypothetical protein